MSVLAQRNSSENLMPSSFNPEDKGLHLAGSSRSSRSDHLQQNRGSYESDEEDQDCTNAGDYVTLGPIVPLKQQLDRDKEDESLRRWKEQLLGCLQLEPFDEHMEPEVQLLSLSIISDGRPDITLSLPFNLNTRGHAFTLKEGSTYCLRIAFLVRHNIVSGLTYVNTVWKNGLKVDNTRTMLGTFGPQKEAYTHMTEEETTPAGILARGAYSAKTKFVDDDKRCYLEIDYSFEIRKEWL